MKINKREKTLLFVLALGVVGFGYYKVVWDYQSVSYTHLTLPTTWNV